MIWFGHHRAAGEQMRMTRLFPERRNVVSLNEMPAPNLSTSMPEASALSIVIEAPAVAEWLT